LTANNRADYLVALANRVLARYNVPAVTKQFKQQDSKFSAEFSHRTWCIDLDRRGFSSSTAPSIDDMAELADSVYHECRHAEQWFLICRLLRGFGQPATYLTDLSIHAKPAKKAGSVPMADGSDESKLALKLCENLCCEQGNTRLMQTQKDLDILHSSNSTQEQILEAKNHLISLGYAKPGASLAQLRNAAHRAYKFQFAEADAWDTGRLAKKLYLQIERRAAPSVL
jgi:hypothetical protein